MYADAESVNPSRLGTRVPGWFMPQLTLAEGSASATTIEIDSPLHLAFEWLINAVSTTIVDPNKPVPSQ